MSAARITLAVTEIEFVSDASASGEMMGGVTKLALRTGPGAHETTSVEFVGTRDELRWLLARMAEVVQ